MKSVHWFGALAVAALLTLAIPQAWRASAQENVLFDSRVEEIHAACQREGVAVLSVRQRSSDKYEVVCQASASDTDQARAEAIMREVLAHPPLQAKVHSVTDALVVARFEPRNKAAQRILRDHYEKLRDESLAERSASKKK